MRTFTSLGIRFEYVVVGKLPNRRIIRRKIRSCDSGISTRRMFIMTYLCRSQYRSVFFYFVCLYCDVCMSVYRVLPSSFRSSVFYIAYTYRIESITLQTRSYYMSVCLSHCLSLSVYVSVCLCLCLSLSMFLSVCLSQSVSLYMIYR